MNTSETEVEQNDETLEHLLGVVVENREKRCREIRENAYQQAREITGLAYTKGRARMHRHIDALREKYRLRVTSAIARNQTLLRQQHQKEDRAILDVAWPLLREAMLALWKQPDSRRNWLHAAVASASSRLRDKDGCIEHPPDLGDEDKKTLEQAFADGNGKGVKLAARDDIAAGIRIIMDGTVIDATLDGLLKQKTMIEATMIARIKQGANNHG